MATNDLVLLDKIIEDSAKAVNQSNNGKFFERFCIEQLLKNYDLSSEELENGITDGNDDGGVDALYIFINGCLLTDIDLFRNSKRDVTIEMLIITSKHADTFEQAVINSEYSTFDDFFRLERSNDQLISSLNEKILEKRELFLDAYLELATKLQAFRIRYFYISRGDTHILGENVLTKGLQLKQLTKDYFSNCEVTYDFLGASQILEMYRRKKEFNIDLPFCEQLSADSQKYIVLCNLVDFYNFLKAENGELKRYLFDSNVRDYNGLNKTNSDILNTLENQRDIDFWWLNNGITILSSGAVNMGKFIRIENVQIVNGLQTSYTIFDYFSRLSQLEDKRKVMVKVITATDAPVRDMIIRATNSQTAISEASLHATDKVQRDIEDIMLKYGFYYERRTNFYANQGYDSTKIFSPLYLARGYLALVKKEIRKSIILRQKFMQNDDQYKELFEECPLENWPKIAKIFRKADELLITKGTSSEGYRKCVRSILSFLSTSYHYKRYDYNNKNLAQLTLADIDKFDMELIYDFIINNSPQYNKSTWKSEEFINNIINKASVELSIHNPNSVIKKRSKIHSFSPSKKATKVSETDIELVKRELPKQPWMPGTHIMLASKLNFKPSYVYNLMSELINRGEFYNQIDGILYDKNGNIISPQ